MSEEVVQRRTEGAVLVIELNRPEALNALTKELLRALTAALEAARDDVGVRALVLTGAGRGFCVGQDLGEVRADGMPNDQRLRDVYHPTIRALLALDKPVLAAVNGACAGAGLSLAAACDIRLAAESARFVPAFADIGLVPDSGASFFLPRILGPSGAFEWMAGGDRLSAAEARERGLVAAVVADDALLPLALERAQALAAKPGVGVGLTKRLMLGAPAATLDAQLETEAQLQGYATTTPEYQAAAAAFLDRSARHA